MGLLGVEEVLKCAIRIEEIGEAFYRQWSQRTENENLITLFNFLADEEISHQKIFKLMMSDLEAANVQPEGIDNEEYKDHLKKIADEVIYNEEYYKKEMKMVTGLISAVEFALKQELDSVIFYSDLKMFVPREHIETMDRIIKEEQKHCEDLEELKRKLFQHDLI